MHYTALTSWPGFTKCCTGVAHLQYLALSKGYLFVFCLNKYKVSAANTPMVLLSDKDWLTIALIENVSYHRLHGLI